MSVTGRGWRTVVSIASDFQVHVVVRTTLWPRNNEDYYPFTKGNRHYLPTNIEAKCFPKSAECIRVTVRVRSQMS